VSATHVLIRNFDMKKIVAFASAAVLGLGVAACDGPAEDAMEDAGEEAAEEVVDDAEAMEDADVITEGEEEAMIDAAEDRADAMEETGEAMDEAAE